MLLLNQCYLVLGIAGLLSNPDKHVFFLLFLNENFIKLATFKGAMSHTAHVREEALHLENVRQLFQVLRVIQYQEFIFFISAIR